MCLCKYVGGLLGKKKKKKKRRVVSRQLRAAGIKQQRKINWRQGPPCLRSPILKTGPQRLLKHAVVCLETGSCSNSCILFLQRDSDNIWLFIAFRTLSPLLLTLKVAAQGMSKGLKTNKKNKIKKVYLKLKQVRWRVYGVCHLLGLGHVLKVYLPVQKKEVPTSMECVMILKR